MVPYDNNEQYDNNNSAGWDPDSSSYHYSYVGDQHAQTPTPPRKEKKSRKGAARAVALVLCCALVGGGAGVGGAALYGSVTAADEPQKSTTIYENKTEPVAVEVQQANGLRSMTLAEIYASYADSCVCITTQTPVQQGWYQYTQTGAGSGFIISEDGFIITNYHVIEGASAIKVTLNNGESYDASIVGGEELNDVAVIKIEGITGLKPVVIGDSDDLRVGETVCTIGNALGSLSFSQTSGGVSATGRAVTMSDGTVINMIQTDCTINAGNSGGPLFDSYGRVVGITSAKYSNNGDSSSASIEGIGFAIPINDVIGIVTDYMQYGYVTGRPSLGVTVATVNSEHQQLFGWPAGLYVNSVESGSCAEKAGMKQGDIITKVGDTEVTSVAELSSAKNSYRAGETAVITVYRAGETLELTVVFDEQVNTTEESSQTQQGTQTNPYQQDPNPQETGYYIDPWSFFFGG